MSSLPGGETTGRGRPAGRGLTGLEAACLAVMPPGPEICGICCGALEAPGAEACHSCRRVERSLRRALGAVTPISITTERTGLYSALRQYKSRPSSKSFRQQRRLALLVGRFVELHIGCIAPEGIDAVTAVPSGISRESPLQATLRMARFVAPYVEGVLEPRRADDAVIRRNAARRSAYECESRLVRGRRILLVDDTYTSGAHLHSAAYSLEEAGAQSVHLLVVGRHQGLSWPPSRRLAGLSAAQEGGWHWEWCVRCRPSPQAHEWPERPRRPDWPERSSWAML